MAETNDPNKEKETRRREEERARAQARTIPRELLSEIRDFGRGLTQRLQAIGKHYAITPPTLEFRTINSGTNGGEDLMCRIWLWYEGRVCAEATVPDMDRGINRVLEDGLHYLNRVVPERTGNEKLRRTA